MPSENTLSIGEFLAVRTRIAKWLECTTRPATKNSAPWLVLKLASRAKWNAKMVANSLILYLISVTAAVLPVGRAKNATNALCHVNTMEQSFKLALIAGVTAILHGEATSANCVSENARMAATLTHIGIAAEKPSALVIAILLMLVIVANAARWIANSEASPWERNADAFVPRAPLVQLARSVGRHA